MEKHEPGTKGPLSWADSEVEGELDRAYEFYAQQYGDLIGKLREAEAEIELLKTPSGYWREPDDPHDTIGEAVENWDPGDIVRLTPVHDLPTIYVLVAEDNDHSIHATRIEAEGAKGATEP